MCFTNVLPFFSGCNGHPTVKSQIVISVTMVTMLACCGVVYCKNLEDAPSLTQADQDLPVEDREGYAGCAYKTSIQRACKAM